MQTDRAWTETGEDKAPEHTQKTRVRKTDKDKEIKKGILAKVLTNTEWRAGASILWKQVSLDCMIE